MISIKVPPLGESIVEATIARWLKKEGDAIAAGDTLVELETDKITVEVPAQKAGVLTKLLKNEGDTVKVDEVLGELDESATVSAVPAAPAAAAKTSPAVRRIAAEEGVDPSQIAGSGRGGRLTKADMVNTVEARQAAPAAEPEATPQAPTPRAAPAPAPAAPTAPRTPQFASNGERETREKLTTRRRRIAEHLLEAQHATAHLTTFNEVDMSAVMALRERLKERVEKEHGVKLTFMPFFIRAAAMALKTYPVVNAQLDGDSIIFKHYVNMGIAVASDQGLVVPVLRDVDRRGMLEVSRDLSAAAKRAREGKLTMEDLTGGTFTITNGGVFGSLVSTPILNYPQVGILGLHKTQDRPIAVAGQVVIRPMMYIALSYDHRIVDGQQAVLFLVRIKELMDDPAAMLVE